MMPFVVPPLPIHHLEVGAPTSGAKWPFYVDYVAQDITTYRTLCNQFGLG
jgi:hypothetical protein